MYGYLAAGRVVQPGDELDERRLARPTRPKQTEDLGRVHFKTGVTQDKILSESLFYMADLNGPFTGLHRIATRKDAHPTTTHVM